MRSVIILLAFLTLDVIGYQTINPQPSPMILPLFHSKPNSSRHRRELETNSQARMKLYDDLLTEGYYTTKLFIGTPPQEFAVIVDTGSTITYVPCSTCYHCGHHQDPRFYPNKSSTYAGVKCGNGCNCNQKINQCMYRIDYAEKSRSRGVLGEDVMSFGSESSLKPQRLVFGCENMESGQLYTQHADGIIGLGSAEQGIMNQLVKKGVIDDSFSLCYGGMDQVGGMMVLGNLPPPKDMVYSHSTPGRSQFYNVEVKDILVSGKSLKLDPKIFDRQAGTILDSGTTFAYLPPEAFAAIKSAIIKELDSPKQIPGADPTFKDVCYSGFQSDISKLSNVFPDLHMVFGKKQKLLLSPENYLFRHSKVHGAYCLGIFASQKDKLTILGGIIVRNTLVTYDRKNNRIGFWKTNCSELSTTSSPSPPPSSVPVPNGFKDFDYNFTGNFQIGFIKFDMYLRMNYSDFTHLVPELTQFMRDKLQTRTSQIEIMSLISKEDNNGSLIKWQISPLQPSAYISNSTAMAIFSLLTDRGFQIPKKFGSFWLLRWKLEALPSRTWWKRDVTAMTLVIGVSTVAIVVALVYLIVCLRNRSHWFKNKLQLHSYQPVDAHVSTSNGQELQQM